MLKVDVHDGRPLRWWYEQFLSKRIDMAPAYQRRAEIWSKWKRSHLIDSILNDFDIPKFYVANFGMAGSEKLNPEKLRYSIIDGKQRLAAIFDFFSDEVSLHPSFVLDEDPKLTLGGLHYSKLRTNFPQLANKVDSFVPTVMNVITDNVHKIEELFIRLNAGEAATGAERRNAMGGPVPVISRELSQHVFFTQRIKFNIIRMQEHNLIVKLLLFEFKNGFSDTKAKNLDDFATEAVKWDKVRPTNEQDDLGIYGEARDRVFEVLERMAPEFKNKDPLLARQGEIPIYYWIAREHPAWIDELRDFILQFSEELLANLRLQRDNPKAGDSELTAYYTASRTTNDLQSLVSRYKIFTKRFNSFRKPGGRRWL